MKNIKSHEIKRVLIDIKHPAQVNLFKLLSRELAEKGWDVTISYLNRGKIPKIIESEYHGFKTISVGSSKGTKWSIIWDGNIKRTLTFLNLLSKRSYAICVAASSIPLALACKLSGVPVIQFYDDPERKRINRINASMSSQLFFPPIVEKSGKISIFNCLKEWSYLSPRRFKPDSKILSRYNLTPYEYIFAREVSNKSFNYFSQDDAVICSFSKLINNKSKVILSLEDKSIASRFPPHWQILEEPVQDIHSLIYYSKLVVSSGDSMAREGAMLGVPSIYCGTRNMKANQLLIDLNILKHLSGKSALEDINLISEKNFNNIEQDNIRENLLHNWDDMIVFMNDQINYYKKAN